MELVDVALRYLDMGWSIIPIRAHDKRPSISSWVQYQQHPATAATIREWFNTSKKLNIAIITGRVSGLVVIDIDSARGQEAYIAEFGEIHNTIRQTTGKPGGLHLLFKANGDHVYRNMARTITDVDVRGEGGYVVVAPSVHPSGRRYEWVIDPIEMGLDDLMDVPDDLHKTLVAQAPAVGQGGGNPDGWMHEAMLGCDRGGRNATGAKLAGYWLRIYGGDAEQVEPLLEMWNSRNRPPLAFKELRQLLKSVAKTHEKEAATGEMGRRMRRIVILEYPDGDVKYQVHIDGYDGYAELAAEDLVNNRRFRISLMKLTRQLTPAIKAKQWDLLVNKLLNDAKVVRVSNDETMRGVVAEAIDAEIRGNPMTEFTYLNSRIIVKDDTIYLKISVLANIIRVEGERVSRKILGKILRDMGFDLGFQWERGKSIRCWQIARRNWKTM